MANESNQTTINQMTLSDHLFDMLDHWKDVHTESDAYVWCNAFTGGLTHYTTTSYFLSTVYSPTVIARCWTIENKLRLILRDWVFERCYPELDNLGDVGTVIRSFIHIDSFNAKKVMDEMIRFDLIPIGTYLDNWFTQLEFPVWLARYNRPT